MKLLLLAWIATGVVGPKRQPNLCMGIVRIAISSPYEFFEMQFCEMLTYILERWVGLVVNVPTVADCSPGRSLLRR